MTRYNSDYSELGKREKQNIRKFRNYHDEEFNEEDKEEFYRKKKKLGKDHMRGKKSEQDWLIE